VHPLLGYEMEPVERLRLIAYKAGLEAAAILCLELRETATTADGRNMAAIAAAKIRGLAETIAPSCNEET
jgi:hypothetical protein